MKRIFFETNDALEQYNAWNRSDKKVFNRLIKLLDNTRNTPFTGLGKPEPLKHFMQGCWSRRITKEHRLIYKVTPEAIIVVSCKYHY